MSKTGYKLSLFLLILLIFLIPGCNRPATETNVLEISGSTMGTTFSVKVVKNNFLLLGNYPEKVRDLQSGINSVLEEVNNLMSTYIPESELSRFNSYRKTNWFKVSADTARVVKTSLDISRKTGGKFDVTVGPLVNLWGFGKDFSHRKVPPESEIKKIKRRVGYKYLSARLSPPALKKHIPDLYCDLSAIAKGFGVDKVAEYLNKKGFMNYLVEVGGEIRVRGRNGKGELWHMGIQSPSEENGLSKIVSFSEGSMATSGDYHNYFEENGVRYSHTIDPFTGYPIRHNLASVTVISDNCMMADALATAIDVMGPEEGFDFALKEKLPVFLIKKEKNGFVKIYTPSFEKILKGK